MRSRVQSPIVAPFRTLGGLVKRIIANILGWISIIAGAFFALVALLLLFTGKMNVAAIFIVPAAALFIAAANLIAYAKRTATPDTNRLHKE
jgi:hypothetical protein